jgi:hypothetical protein
MSILFPLYSHRKAEDNKISPGSDNGVCPLEKMEGEKERRKEGERNLWHPARTSRHPKGLRLSGKLQITNPKLQTWGVLRTGLNAFGVKVLIFF